MTNKLVVLFKTHLWNDDIEKFADKIYEETRTKGVDFFILMNFENNNIINNIKNVNLKNITKVFGTEDIKKIYSKGFYNLYLSNHWILMWFFKINGGYDYYWSIEYDVRITGDSSKIWTHESDNDFLFPLGNHRNLGHTYRRHYFGTSLTDNDKHYGYLQLARYSNQALKYLDEQFMSGENGQDEMITFSLLNKGKFKMSKLFLRSLIKGFWTWKNSYSAFNRKMYDAYENMNDDHLFIFHPIK